MQSDPTEEQNPTGEQPQLLIKQVRIPMGVKFCNSIKNSNDQSCQEMEADSLEEPRSPSLCVPWSSDPVAQTRAIRQNFLHYWKYSAPMLSYGSH